MKKEKRIRDYHRLLLTNYAIGILGAFMIVAFFSIYLISSFKSTILREREELRVITSSAASRTQNLFGNLLITVKLLDEWMQNNPSIDPRFDGEFNRLVNAFRDGTDRKIDLRMVTESGGLFYLPSMKKEALADVSDREYYFAQQGLPAMSLYFAEPVKSRVTGKWGIPVSFKLRENAHGLLAIFAVVEFSIFDETFRDIIEKPERSVAIVRRDLTVLARSPYNDTIVGKKYPVQPNAKGYDVLTLHDKERKERAVSYIALDDLPLYVMVADSYTRVKEQWFVVAMIRTAIALLILGAYLLLNVRLIQLLRDNDEIQKKLEIAARFDSLTGMKNRRYFFERCGEEIGRAKRAESPLVLLVADIDRFKSVNDTWGHPEGDRVLVRVASAIEAHVRNADISGRIGGEEFAILLTDTDAAKGIEIAERIRGAAESITLGEWNGGLSIGVAVWKGKDEPMEELFKRADDALYVAKETGRNRIHADS